MPLSTDFPSTGMQHGMAPPYRELTMQDLQRTVARYWRLIVASAGLALVLAAALFAGATRQYKATAVIQVQKESADALGLDNITGHTEAAPDSLESTITQQTEVQILQSESLALKVIKALDLERTADFHAHFSPLGWALGLFAPRGIADQRNASIEDAPARRSRAVRIFEAHLKVKSMSGTRLISVQYYSADPKIAAAVANLLVQDLIEYNFDTRHLATQQASQWLNGQLSDLRKQSEALQAQLIDLQQGSGVFSLGQTDTQGREQTYAPVLDRLQQASTQLAQAQTSRIMKGALYQIVKDGDPELIAGLAGTGSLAGGSPGLSNPLALLQDLRGQEAQTRAQLDEMSAKFGSGYPKLEEIRAKLESTEEAIRQEATRIAARVRNDYTVAQDVEAKDRDTFQQEKEQAQKLNQKTVQYELVRQEASQSRTLYENLLGRLKEADLVAGLHSSNITPVDQAYIPARPAKPDVLLYGAAGLCGGLLLGLCLALYRGSMNYRVEDLNGITMIGLSAPIGLLPQYTAKVRARQRGTEPLLGAPPSLALPAQDAESAARRQGIAVLAEPRSAYTEALRALRTTLQNSSSGTPPQILLITSSIPGEGKSMLSLNLAILYAQSNKKVLLVDGDLRTPVLHQRLKTSGEQGLGNALEDDHKPSPVQTVSLSADATKTLDFLAAGTLPEYPAELLASKRMTDLISGWRQQYDHILIDGAPLLPVTDSAVLSRYADLTLVAARQSITDRRSLERSWHVLVASGVRKAAIVLNGVRARGEQQYQYYGYKPTAPNGKNLHA